MAMRSRHVLGWVLLVVVLAPGVMSRAAEPQPQAEPKKPADPPFVAAQTLAQAVEDDVNATARRYQLTELQTDGVVAKHVEYKGKVAVITFKLMVKDRESDKMVEFTITCVLKEPLLRDDKGLDAMAVGKKVTVRGTSIGMGNRQVTLNECVLVGEQKK